MHRSSLLFATTIGALAALNTIALTGCERSLLHPLADPLPANDQGGGACAADLAPTGLTATVFADRVEISWTDNADGALNFVIERRSSGGFEDLTVALTETRHTDTLDLDDDTVFGYRVRAESETCTTAATEPVDALTFPAAPGAPEAVGGADDITLMWDDTNNNESGYRVEVVNSTEVETLPADTESYVDDDLAADLVRTYRIFAVNASGETSVDVDGGTKPNPPTGLTVSAVSATALRLDWVDSNANEAGYRVYRTTGATTVPLTDLVADTATYTDSGLPDASAFTYAVVAFNAGGESDPAEVEGVTPCDPSAKPASLAATTGFANDAHTSAFVDISWGATLTTNFSWRVERDDGAGYSQIATVTDALNLGYTDSSVVPDTAYTYRITAFKGSCEISSDPFAFTSAPDVITTSALTVDSISTTTLGLGWTDVNDNETGYAVYYRPVAGSWTRFGSTAAADATSIELSGLTANTEYRVVVIGESAGYVPRANLDLIAATAWTLPDALTSVVANPLSTTSLTLDWSATPAGTMVRIDRASAADGIFSIVVEDLIGTSYTDNTLTDGLSYSYLLYVVNVAGPSAPYELDAAAFFSPALRWASAPSLDTTFCTIELTGVVSYDANTSADFVSASGTVPDIGEPGGFLGVTASESGLEVFVGPDIGREDIGTPGNVTWTVVDSNGSSSTLDRDITLAWAADTEQWLDATAARNTYGPGLQTLADVYTAGCGDTCVGERASISAGTDSTCVLGADRRVWCFGDDTDGELGNGNANVSGYAGLVCSDDNPDCSEVQSAVEQVSVGGNFACSLRGGALQCWGDNTYGQLALPLATTSLDHPPMPVAGGFFALATGQDHACALDEADLDDLGVSCWGRNAFGALGRENLAINDTDPTPAPVCLGGFAGCAPDDLPARLTSVESIAAGSYHTCAVTSSDKVWCWGQNADGQLGSALSPQERAPVTVSCGGAAFAPANCDMLALSGVFQIAAGSAHTCAVLATDASSPEVACWGDQGSLGRIDATGDSAVPVAVCAGGTDNTCSGYLRDVVSLSAGGPITCALKADGTVWCWGGGNLSKEPQPWCEDGFQTECTSAPAVRAVAVDVGLNHLCAVETTGQVRCWGFNGAGALGDPNVGAGSTNTALACTDNLDPCTPIDDATLRTCGTLDAVEVTP